MKTLMKAGAIAVMISGLASNVHAADSASVDAVATLELQNPPLALSGVQALSFGTINIPNGTQAGNKCVYNVNSYAGSVQHALKEVNSGGSTVYASVPTASGCNWGNSANFTGENGIFSIQCNPSTPTTFSATFNAGALTDVTLAQPYTGYHLYAYVSGSNTGLSSSTTNELTYPCPNSGAIDVWVGGSVSIGENAVAGANVTVGTVTLDATY